MSYPDKDEARVESMLDDLAGAAALPESVEMMNEAAVRSIVGGAFRPGAFFEALENTGSAA